MDATWITLMIPWEGGGGGGEAGHPFDFLKSILWYLLPNWLRTPLDAQLWQVAPSGLWKSCTVWWYALCLDDRCNTIFGFFWLDPCPSCWAIENKIRALFYARSYVPVLWMLHLPLQLCHWGFFPLHLSKALVGNPQIGAPFGIERQQGPSLSPVIGCLLVSYALQSISLTSAYSLEAS